MDKPFQAYAGDAPYLFVCYAHDDKTLVYPELIRLKDAGYNIWYDEGISPGSEWSDSIASHIEDCAAFLYFVTPRSIASEHCRREVNFAAEQPCEMLAIHLEDTDLPSGLKLMLSHRQAILKHDHSPSVYQAKLVQALSLVTNTRSDSTVQKEVRFEAPKPKGFRFLLAIVLVIALISVSGIYYYGSRSEPASMQEPEVNLSKENTPAVIAKKSIAVLPFLNLSSDPEQDYFADGLTEELLNKLARVNDLQVTARTSSFFYKNKQINVQEVGKTLGVAHLLEGSVRKSGDQLRITAQLINTIDGFHLWSESFDRPLSDVFSIQDEIAEKVTTALSITIGAGEFDQPGMTNNIEAYEAYLRSLSGGVDDSLEQVAHLERAVKLDPNFGLAWSQLVQALTFSYVNQPPDQQEEYIQRMIKAGAQAKALPGTTQGDRMMNAYALVRTGDLQEAERQFIQIFDEYGGSAATALVERADLLVIIGRPGDGLPMMQRAKRLDPLSRRTSFMLAHTLTVAGKFDEGIAEAERGFLLEETGDFALLHLIKWYIAIQTGDRFIVADAIAETMGEEDPMVLGLRANDIETASTWARDFATDPLTPLISRVFVIHLAAMLGDPELALEIILQNPLWGLAVDGPMWMDHMSDVRQLPGFKNFLRDAGIVDYWINTGKWAYKCRPLASDENDFECF